MKVMKFPGMEEQFEVREASDVFPGQTEFLVQLGEIAKLSGIPGDCTRCVTSLAIVETGWAKAVATGKWVLYALQRPEWGPFRGQWIAVRYRISEGTARLIRNFDDTHVWNGGNVVRLLPIQRTERLTGGKAEKNARRQMWPSSHKRYDRANAKPRGMHRRSLTGLIHTKEEA